MNTDSPALAQYDFRSGLLRGSSLSLDEATLMHRGRSRLETVPLKAIAAVRIAFERDLNKIGWAIVLFLIAWAISSVAPWLTDKAEALAGGMRDDGAASLQGVASVMIATFRGLGAAARSLPTISNLLGMVGIVLLVIGLWGRTTLTLTLAAVEREYAVRGRNRRLFEFAETLCERLAEPAF